MAKTFEVTIFGASGGPLDGNTQCFMVRPIGSEGLSSICIDGGAGVGQITKLISQMNHHKLRNIRKNVESFYENDMESVEIFVNEHLEKLSGFSNTFEKLIDMQFREKDSNTMRKALVVYKGIKEYYITHAHLDHIAGMVLNTPMVFDGNDMSVDRKEIYGLHDTITALDECMFNNRIWPDLTQDGTNRIKLNKIEESQQEISDAIPRWGITPFQVTHGRKVNSKEIVTSSVYVIEDKIIRNNLIICGDLDYDITGNRENSLDKIWEYLATNVLPKHVVGIFIECSSPSSVDNDKLYGHLSPIFLVNALIKLKEIYEKHYGSSEQLSLDVIVTHIKMTDSQIDPRIVILEELNKYSLSAGLRNFKFSIAIQGYTYMI